MFLAFKEMARAKVRFGSLVAALALLVFLILFQQSLQNGLLTSFVGAIRNQSAPVLVYSVDGQRVIQGSVITPDLEQKVRALPDAAAVGRIGQGTFSVSAGGELTEATVLGYEDADLGAPTTIVGGRLPEVAGEAIASDVDASTGFGIGDVVRIEPGGLEIEVVGLARDSQLNAGPTVFVPYVTFVDAVRATNPDAGEPLPNVLGAAPVDGVDATTLAERINELSEGLDALPRSVAADETPGVSQVQQSFRIIFLLYGLVIPCVTGLFFLIVTFQKSRALTLLRAIGAPAGRLVGSLLLQAVVIIGLGLVIGVALYAPVSQQRLGGIQLRFETVAVVTWAVVLLALGVGSSLLAVRRVLAIDPVEATTGGGQL